MRLLYLPKFCQAFGSQTSKQPSGSLQGSSMSSISNFPKSPVGYQQSPASSVQHRDIDRQSLELLNGMMTSTSAMDQAYVEDNKNENQDDSIWLKEKWAIGEEPGVHVRSSFAAGGGDRTSALPRSPEVRMAALKKKKVMLKESVDRELEGLRGELSKGDGRFSEDNEWTEASPSPASSFSL